MNKWFIGILVIFILIYIWYFPKKNKKNRTKHTINNNLVIKNKTKNKAKKVLLFSKITKKKEENNENTKIENDTPKTQTEINISFIIDNFLSLEAPTTKKGKIAFDKMQNILKSDPEESFNKLKETINSTKLKTERQKQFFIQLANRINVDDSKKMDLLYDLANKYFYKEKFNNDQELYTAEIAFESVKNSITDEEQLNKLEEIKNNVQNERLKTLLEKI